MKIEQFITTLKNNPVRIYDTEQDNTPIVFKGKGVTIPSELHTKSIIEMKLSVVNNVPTVDLYCANRMPRKSHLGEETITKTGHKITIVKHESMKNINVQFEDGTVLENQTYAKFKNGTIFHPIDDKNHKKKASDFYTKKNERIGMSIEQNGKIITIIDYITAQNMTVQSEDGKITYNVTWQQFKNKNIPTLILSEYSWQLIDEYGKKTNLTYDEALDICQNKDEIPQNEKWRKQRIAFMFGWSHNRHIIKEMPVKINKSNYKLQRVYKY